jgi:uncharacterized membrane protein YqjE
MQEAEMNSPPEPATSLWSSEARQLAANAVEMLELRRELAELEVRHDAQAGKRLGLVGGVAAVLIVTALPLLLTALAHGLAGWTRINDPSVWMLILGGFSLFLGAGLGWAAYRRFRSDFSGLRGTLAELQEDVVWLREWTQSEPSSK